MRLTNISITNCAGFDSVNYSLPAIALVQGANRAGKSALAACIKYPLQGGHDPDMLTPGQDQGEIILRLDDGGGIRAVLSREKRTTTRYYQAPGASKWDAGREAIDGLVNGLSFDPLRFLRLPEKEQILELLKVLGPSLTVSGQELSAAMGEIPVPSMVAGVPDGLDKVDALLSEKPGCGSIYDQRRDANVAADTLKKHAGEIEKALPPPSAEPLKDGSWDRVAAKAHAEIEALNAKEQQAIAGLGKVFSDEKDKLRSVLSTGEREVDAEIDAKIRALEAERIERKRALIALHDAAVEDARNQANAAAGTLAQANAPIRARLTAQHATALERHNEWIRTEGSRKEVENARAEASRKQALAERLSGAVDRLRALRTKIAERIPIKGCKIVDGRLLNDQGVPFKKWNTEAQMSFCLRIAVLTHGELGFVVVDGCEAFDAQHTQALLAACSKYTEAEGMQFVLLSVGEGALEVSNGDR
jgi:hypothetical protein